MGMQGAIIVGQPSAADALHQPSTTEIDAYRNLMLRWFDKDDVPMLERRDWVRDADPDEATDG